MDQDMEYIYSVSNASLILRIIHYFVVTPSLQSSEITVIHEIDGWVIRIKVPYYLTAWQYGNVKAFLSELGFVYHPSVKMNLVFCSLDMGESVISVMQNYNVAIVSHGNPNVTEVEAFRLQFSQGLGYRPQTLA
jgi:hypothetical protein